VEGTEKKKILIVEDSATAALATSHVLGQFGYQSIIVDTGEAAVEAVRGDPSLSLVLMDIELGSGIDGAEAARRILAVRALPIVFLTAYAEEHMAERVRGITRYGYVIKDSSEYVLQSAIEMAYELFDAHCRIADSEERYRLLSENTDDVIWLWDLARNRYEYVGSSVLRLLGFAVDEVMRQSLSDALPAKHAGLLTEELPRRVAALEAGDESARFKTYAVDQYHKDGRLIPTEVSTSLVTDLRGRVTGLQGVTRDISEQRRLTTELAQANRHLAALWGVAELADAGFKEICDHILRAVVEMTGSGYGFYGFINDDESVMTIHAWSGDAMRDCALVDKPQDFSIASAGVWAEAVRRREALVINDFAAPHDAKRGYPAGHVALSRLLAVPVFSRGRIVSVAAVANRETPYGPADVSQVGAFLTGIMSVVERRRAEEEVRRLLAEKELLLREVHHRIKNNMSTVISLLDIQSNAPGNEAAGPALEEANRRLRVMMIIYDKLYRSKEYGALSADRYLEEFVPDMFSGFPHGGRVRLDMAVEPISLDVKFLFPLGIIINELLANSMKYAFPEGRTGTVRIGLRRSDAHAVELVFRDDGIGFAGDVDLASARSFGLQLVSLLVRQINGAVAVNGRDGAEYVITFAA